MYQIYYRDGYHFWEYGDCYFFFQAEDGIRDLTVTGVQTCALPISESRRAPPSKGARRHFLHQQLDVYIQCLADGNEVADSRILAPVLPLRNGGNGHLDRKSVV